jgi:hypothetical protein
MANRLAEFTLYLARSANVARIEPSSLDEAAEPAFRALFRRAQMNDSRDWRSLIGAYAAWTEDALMEALKKP